MCNYKSTKLQKVTLTNTRVTTQPGCPLFLFILEIRNKTYLNFSSFPLVLVRVLPSAFLLYSRGGPPTDLTLLPTVRYDPDSTGTFSPTRVCSPVTPKVSPRSHTLLRLAPGPHVTPLNSPPQLLVSSLSADGLGSPPTPTPGIRPVPQHRSPGQPASGPDRHRYSGPGIGTRGRPCRLYGGHQ